MNFSSSRRNNARVKYFSEQDPILKNKFTVSINVKVDINEIKEILQKTINKKLVQPACHKKSNSLAYRELNLSNFPTPVKRISSPAIYKPFKVRCQSHLLKVKFKPKSNTKCDFLIVKQY